MILIDNLNFLRENHRDILEQARRQETDLDPAIQVVDARNGLPTLQIALDDTVQYIHSKYNPVQEAERIVGQYEQNEIVEHVFFYGLGLGYHIEAFLNKFPHVTYTLYEPNPTIFHHYVSTRLLTDLSKSGLKHLFVEYSRADAQQFFYQFANTINDNVLFIILPSYERIFKEQYQEFRKQFKKAISDKRFGLRTNLAFEKRWTINSIVNFSEVIQTPNMLVDIDRSKFADKPAIIVAAGPSLIEEIDNLRYIKENKLAYIFSVGSAINTLIEYGIYPHAACTYDPSERNQLVFEKLKKERIDSIPLIFGSSVGYETLKDYPGIKLHVLSNQDTVSSYYLQNTEGIELERIHDAPSIAVFTLQLLSKLGCNPVILVGQNLAYRDKRRYAKGINYEYVSSELSEKELETALKVESVDGKEILTNEGFNRMRKEMEMYIQHYKDMEVINTTVGGAKIEGTEFQPLKELIGSRLTSPVVDESFFKGAQPSYDLEYIARQQRRMDREHKLLNEVFVRLRKQLADINRQAQRGNDDQLDRLFNRFDKEFKRLVRNEFYTTFLQPMLRIQYELANREMQAVRFEKDLVLKAETIVKAFTQYIDECQKNMEILLPFYTKLRELILNKTKREQIHIS